MLPGLVDKGAKFHHTAVGHWQAPAFAGAQFCASRQKNARGRVPRGVASWEICPPATTTFPISLRCLCRAVMASNHFRTAQIC